MRYHFIRNPSIRSKGQKVQNFKKLWGYTLFLYKKVVYKKVYIKRLKIKIRLYNLAKLRNFIRKSVRKYYMLTRMPSKKFIIWKTKATLWKFHGCNCIEVIMSHSISGPNDWWIGVSHLTSEYDTEAYFFSIWKVV